MFTKQFWKAVAERAVKSAAQGALAIWAVVQISDADSAINTVQAAGWGALSMAVLSVLTSVASGIVSDKPGPSLTNAEVLSKDIGLS